jgi:hypothetical protein
MPQSLLLEFWTTLMLERKESGAMAPGIAADARLWAYLSGIVLAAVPRFMESHVVPRLQFNPPAIFLPFGRTRH